LPLDGMSLFGAGQPDAGTPQPRVFHR
jgi:hypothetical protein